MTDERPGDPASRPHRHWDRHSKRVLAAGLPDLLRGLGLDHGSTWARQTVELPAGAHRPDLLYVSPEGVVVHVEVQQAPDPDMAARMAEYAVRVTRAASFRDVLTDLVQVVVQMTGPPMPVCYRVGRLRNDVHLVHVPTMSWRGYELASPLTPLALAGGDENLVEPVASAVADAADAGVRASMAALAFSLAPDLTGRPVQTLGRIGMADVIDVVRETEFGRGLLAEGREQGLSQGLSRGLDEGLHRGERDTLVRLLTARFPGIEAARVQATVDHLLAEHGHDAARVVLELAEPDLAPAP